MFCDSPSELDCIGKQRLPGLSVYCYPHCRHALADQASKLRATAFYESLHALRKHCVL